MATNKLYNQGNYNYGDLLINSSLNINVKTSSLIAVNLINILVEKYGNLGSEELDSNTTPSYMKDFLSKYFNKYIYNRFYEVLSNNVISSPYGNNEYYKNENALWCYYYQRNQNNFISFYDDYNSNYKNQQIRLQPLYYTGNGTDTSKYLQILNVSSDIDDNIIMNLGYYDSSGRTVILQHKNQFNNDVVLGSSNNTSTDNGYDETFIVPNITVDKYGHIRNFTNYTIKTPSWSDCAKIIFSGNVLIGSDSTYVNLYETINNFTMIIFNFNYIYNSSNIISIPIYTKNIQYQRQMTDDKRLMVDTGFRLNNVTYNTHKLIVCSYNSNKTTLMLKINVEGTYVSSSVYLKSIVGYVVP